MSVLRVNVSVHVCGDEALLKAATVNGLLVMVELMNVLIRLDKNLSLFSIRSNSNPDSPSGAP